MIRLPWRGMLKYLADLLVAILPPERDRAIEMRQRVLEASIERWRREQALSPCSMPTEHRAAACSTRAERRAAWCSMPAEPPPVARSRTASARCEPRGSRPGAQADPAQRPAVMSF